MSIIFCYFCFKKRHPNNQIRNIKKRNNSALLRLILQIALDLILKIYIFY